MSLDEPDLTIDATRNLSEEIGGVGVAEAGGLADRLASGLAVGGQRQSDREQMRLLVGDAQRKGTRNERSAAT